MLPLRRAASMSLSDAQKPGEPADLSAGWPLWGASWRNASRSRRRRRMSPRMSARQGCAPPALAEVPGDARPEGIRLSWDVTRPAPMIQWRYVMRGPRRPDGWSSHHHAEGS